MKINFPAKRFSAISIALLLPCHAGSIHDAVAKRDVAALDSVLKNQPNQINSRCYPDFRTPLHMAVVAGDPAMVKILLDYGADMALDGPASLSTAPTPVRLGETPIMFAAFSGSLSAVRILVAHRADVGAEDLGRTSVIGYAAAAGHDDVVRFIYQNGGRDLIRLTRQDQLFAQAASGGNRQLVELLLAEGVNVDIRDETGATPLLNAAGSHPDLARLLIGKGADKAARSKSGTSLFSMACFGGDVAMVKELLADQVVRASDPGVMTDAAKAGCVEIVEVLIQKETDLNSMDSRLRIIHELIEAGAKTTETPAGYKSFTGYARDRGCPEILELLENPPPPKPRKP